MKNFNLFVLLVAFLLPGSCQSNEEMNLTKVRIIEKYERLALDQEEKHWNYIVRGLNNIIIYDLLSFKDDNPKSLAEKIKNWLRNSSSLIAIEINLKVDDNKEKPYLLLWKEKHDIKISTKNMKLDSSIISQTKEMSSHFAITSDGKNKGYKGKLTIYYSSKPLKNRFKQIRKEISYID